MYQNCMNNTSYLLKTKNRWQLKINKTQKLSDLINTALTGAQCIKTRKLSRYQNP